GYPRAQCGYFRCLRSIDFEDACGGQKTAKKLRPKPVRNLNVRGITRPAANFFRPFKPWDRFADEFECHLSPPSETRVEDGAWQMTILDPQSSILDWSLSYNFTLVNTRSGFFWNIFNLSSAVKNSRLSMTGTRSSEGFPVSGRTAPPEPGDSVPKSI